MSNIADLDKLIADNVREFELGELRRQKFTAAERDRMLTETLGPKTQPQKNESFVVGDAAAGVTSQSVWFEFRRIHFAVIVSIALGEMRDEKASHQWVDINCTLRRSYRINVPTIPEADNFLVGLSRFTSFKIVPTVEDDIREQRRAEELAAATEASVERRHRRMECLAMQQQRLLNELIQVECAPRIAFGLIG